MERNKEEREKSIENKGKRERGKRLKKGARE
jgi:hypothetical protein